MATRIPSPVRATRAERVLHWTCGLTGGGCLLAIVVPLIALWFGYRPAHLRPPEPRGLVLRIELPEPLTPWGNASVRVLPSTPPRLLVTWRVDSPGKDFAYLSAEHEYPSGARATNPIDAAAIDPISASASFDFDGDRVDDQLECVWEAGSHRTTVTSGASGRVLFAHEDPREYEYEVGAFPLGDVDGDGCAELALSHPRFDRSYYDWPEDCLWEARSWITVVSGRLACSR